MFHRVDDWRQMPSSRYFLLAEQLHHYDGAVRAVLRMEVEKNTPPQAPMGATAAGAPPAAAVPHGAVVASPSLPTISGEALAAMTVDDGGRGLPGIEFAG